jgi:tripartite tricarboxylate transporter TctB family protein
MTAVAGRRERSFEAILFDVLMIVIVGAILVDALSLRPATRFVPFVVGIPTFIGLLYLLGRDVIGRPVAPTAPSGPPVGTYDPTTGEHQLPDLASADLGELIRAAEEEEAADDVLPDSPEARRRQLLLAAWAVGVFLVGYAVDFLVAVPVGLFTIFLLTRQRLVVNLGITIAVTAFVYALFVRVLEVRF